MENTTTYLYTIHTDHSYPVPAAINTLSVAVITETSVQLNFTAPMSEFPVAYYEVRVNGNFWQEIAASGSTIYGLTAGNQDTITVRAVNVNMHAAKFWSNAVKINVAANIWNDTVTWDDTQIWND